MARNIYGMKDYIEYNEARELGRIYPDLEKLEQALKEANIDPDEFFLNAFDIKLKEEYKEILNEFEPMTAATMAGLWGLKKGYDKIGGWQGVKNIAKAGWQGLQNTGSAMKSAYDVQRSNTARDAAQRNAAVGGGTGTKGSDPTEVEKWADSIATSAQNLASNVSDVMKNDPQMRHLMDLIAKVSAQLKQRAASVSQANPAAP